MAISEQVYKWRLNTRPRFTVLEIGEYMVADDGPRETMLRDMKYERLGRTLTYRKLRPAVARFLASPTRDKRILAECQISLEEDRDAASGQQRENLNYELRALDAFQRSVNALEIGGFNLERASPATALKIEGVSVSVQPTAHIRVARPRGSDLVGAIVVDVAKGIDYKSDEGKERATSAMRHSAMLVHQYASDRLVSDALKASPEHCIIFHSYRQERVCSPENYARPLRNIEAVCRNIARSWSAIPEPPGFNMREARVRH